MKKFILILVGICAGLATSAQSNLYFNNFWQDTYLLNPAAIDQLAPDWKFGLGSRKQWLQMTGSPVTGQFSFMYCNEAAHLQTSLSVTADRIGYTYTTDIGLSYAYLLFLGNSQLNMGVSLHLQNLFYDKSKIITQEGGDPAIDFLTENWWRQAKFNSDFGIEYIYNSDVGNFLFGAVSKNFIPKKVLSSDLDIFPNTNYVYGRYHSGRRDNMFSSGSAGNFDYSIAAVGIHTGNLEGKANFLQAILNVNVHWNYDDYIFSAGLLYGTKEDLGIVLGLDIVYNFSASLIYLYNWTIRKDILNPAGSFELVLTYRINPKGSSRPCKKRGAECLPERKIARSPY